MQEKAIALTDIESVLGVKISAAELPAIGEGRIRMPFGGDAQGARMTVVFGKEGKWQNAASFKSKDGTELSPEYIVVLHGSAYIATPGRDGDVHISRVSSGDVISVEAGEPHATRPSAGSVIVGIMASDWNGMQRTMHPEFDELIKQRAAG